MTCPSCGSEDVRVQVVTIHQLRNRHHSVLYWILVGWWLQPLLWICFSIPMLMIRLFAPRDKKLVAVHSSMAVCQQCGQVCLRLPCLLPEFFQAQAKFFFLKHKFPLDNHTKRIYIESILLVG